MDLIALCREVEQAAGHLEWTVTVVGGGPAAMRHYTGRGVKWLVQLVVLPTADGPQRLGTATAEGLVLKLPPELARIVEDDAKQYLTKK